MNLIFTIIALLIVPMNTASAQNTIDGAGGWDTAYLYGNETDLVDLPDGNKLFTTSDGTKTTLINFEAYIVLAGDITFEEKAPLTIAGKTASGRAGTYQPPVTWTVNPPAAGTIDTTNPNVTYFVPTNDYIGTATLTASALNNKNNVITGQRTINVTEPPSTSLEITVGNPVPK